MDKSDLDLMQRAADALAEIDRTSGLDDRHADVLTALRIRLEGGPRKSLEEMLKATEGMKGPKMPEPKPKGPGLDDLMAAPEKKKPSLDDLL